MSTSRRDVLVGLVTLAACAGKDGAVSDTDSTACVRVSSGSGPMYCLLEHLHVRVVGGASLLPGQAVLANVDDNTAVLLARDADGLYARSAICTHACCVVALCVDASCAQLTPTPDACAQTPVTTPDSAGGILCPCHGSLFRLSDGAVLTGPATKPLPAYGVTVDGEDVWVDTGTVVAPADRA